MRKKKPAKNPARESGAVKVLGTEVSAELKEALDSYAATAGRSKRWVVEHALIAYLNQQAVCPDCGR